LLAKPSILSCLDSPETYNIISYYHNFIEYCLVQNIGIILLEIYKYSIADQFLSHQIEIKW